MLRCLIVVKRVNDKSCMRSSGGAAETMDDTKKFIQRYVDKVVNIIYEKGYKNMKGILEYAS